MHIFTTEHSSPLAQTLDMFLFLAIELTILFLAISYLVGILQHYLLPAKIQSILSSQSGKGYVIAALLGSITPFCSCSTIPFLKGLIKSRAGFGPMMVFLFASPLLNPVIIGLLVATFNWQVALFYFVIAMSISVIAGYVLEKLGFECYIKAEALGAQTSSCCNAKPKTTNSCNTNNTTLSCSSKATTPTTQNIWKNNWNTTWKDFKQVLPYLLLGISIGSLIYGFVPTDLIVKYADDNTWYAILVAAIIGIPLYIRTEAVIPLSMALVQKGMALGSVMALIIGSAGASLTEVILLRSIFKNQLVIAFVIVILTMAISAGYLYTVLFG